MKRVDKYPDTDCFHFYNANPHNKYTGDCVIRALSTALDKSWEIVVRELTELGLKYGYVLTDTALYDRYLKLNGWIKHAQPRDSDNKKYICREFCHLLSGYADKNSELKKVIAHLGTGHIAAIIDFKVYDIWDSSIEYVGNYWVKE